MRPIRAILTSLLLLWAVPLYAQTASLRQQIASIDFLTHVAISAQAAGQFADAVSTEGALASNPSAFEANGLMGYAVSSPARLALIKASVAIAETYLLWHLHRSHPALASLLAAVQASIAFYVAHQNSLLIVDRRVP